MDTSLFSGQHHNAFTITALYMVILYPDVIYSIGRIVRLHIYSAGHISSRRIFYRVVFYQHILPADNGNGIPVVVTVAIDGVSHYPDILIQRSFARPWIIPIVAQADGIAPEVVEGAALYLKSVHTNGFDGVEELMKVYAVVVNSKSNILNLDVSYAFCYLLRF